MEGLCNLLDLLSKKILISIVIILQDADFFYWHTLWCNVSNSLELSKSPLTTGYSYFPAHEMIISHVIHALFLVWPKLL